MPDNMPTPSVPPKGPTFVSDVEDSLNVLEQLSASANATDDYLKGILQAQELQLQMATQQGAIQGSVNDDTIEVGGRFSVPGRGALPEDAIGTVARDIQENDTGPAVFDLNGGRYFARVRNDDADTLQAGTAVRCVGGQNRVTARGAAGGFGTFGIGEGFFRYKGNLFQIPDIVDRDQDVKVANQLYIRGDYQTVSSTLDPGEEKEFARIEPARDQIFLLKTTNATAHSTVKYNYYIDGTDPDQDLSGTMPWATPPDHYEVVDGGYNIVEDYVALEIAEASGSNSYSTVSGSLTGLLINV